MCRFWAAVGLGSVERAGEKPWEAGMVVVDVSEIVEVVVVPVVRVVNEVVVMRRVLVFVLVTMVPL